MLTHARRHDSWPRRYSFFDDEEQNSTTDTAYLRRFLRWIIFFFGAAQARMRGAHAMQILDLRHARPANGLPNARSCRPAGAAAARSYYNTIQARKIASRRRAPPIFIDRRAHAYDGL